MNSLSVTVPVPKIIAFRKFIKDDYRNMDSDQIKKISYKIIDDDGKIIIYYIRSLKFEKGTSYYYVILDDGSLLLIDGSVKDQFISDKTIEINVMNVHPSYQKYTTNKFVQIIRNGYNYKYSITVKGKIVVKTSIYNDTHLNSLTFLVLMISNPRYNYTQDEVDQTYEILYEFSISSFPVFEYYNTDDIL
jgi:hypothetical protein